MLKSVVALSSVALLLVGACGGDTSDDPEVESETDENEPADKTSKKAADETEEEPDPVDMAPECDAVEGTDAKDLDPKAFECKYFCIPNEQISDFSAENWSGGSWGNSISLTGTRFPYSGEGSANAKETHDAKAGTLNLSGETINYVGWGLAFGPCTNASRWTGIEITAYGDLGGASLTLQVQDNNNLPISSKEESRGACVPKSDATTYSDCKNNEAPVEGIEATSTSIKIPFKDIKGGSIFSPVDPEELYGLQLQIGCGPEAMPCTYDLTLEKLNFY